MIDPQPGDRIEPAPLTRYLMWSALNETWEEYGTRKAAMQAVEDELDYARDMGDGWPDCIDTVAAYALAPLCRLVQYVGEEMSEGHREEYDGDHYIDVAVEDCPDRLARIEAALARLSPARSDAESELLRVVRELDEGTLARVYGIEADSDAPLDRAIFAVRGGR